MSDKGDEIFALTIPKWGLTMQEGTLVKWHVEEGGTVNEGEVVADIETTKITNELEARVAGTLRKQVAQEGDTLDVGALIGVVADADVPEDAISDFIASFVPESDDGDNAGESGDISSCGPSENVATQDGSGSPNAGANVSAARSEWDIPQSLMLADGQSNDDQFATPQVFKLAGRYAIDLSQIEGTGRRQRISKSDLAAAVERAGGSAVRPNRRRAMRIAAHGSDTAHINATPLARRVAKLLNVNLAQVSPSGRRGRIRTADVEAFFKTSGAAPSAAPAGSVSTADADSQISLIAGEGENFTDQPLNAMRSAIAQRLSLSKRIAPHFRVTADLPLDRLIALRKEHNAAEQQKLSLNDYFVKLVAQALAEFPQINIQFDGTTLRQFEDAHIAIAVALDEGLITPILRGANRKSVNEISTAIGDMAARARQGKLKPDEIEGGSFSLSNLGMFGIAEFDAIINPPQCAILALGAGEKRQVFDADDAWHVTTMMRATLSSDHRVIDGAVAAQFMQLLSSKFASPEADLS